MMKANQVMIEIETLSSASNAAIVSIGACMFDMTKGADYADPEDSFLVGIDPEYYTAENTSSVDFDISARTVKWWSQQSDAAKASLKINQMTDLKQALEHLGVWLFNKGFEKDNTPYEKGAARVWAMPSQFDLVILRNAAKHVYGSTNDVPWHYRQETDARTYMWTFGDLEALAQQGRKSNGVLSGLIKHRADHDAVRQARIIQYITNLRNDNGQADPKKQAA